VILAGTLVAPKRYYSTSSFSINWSKMPIDDNDIGQKKARINYNLNLPKLRFSDELVSQLCSALGIQDTESDLVKIKLIQDVRVKVIRRGEDIDVYQVQAIDDDRNFALNAADLVCKRLVSRVNLAAKAQNAFEGLKSYGENTDTQDEQEQLGQELARLSQQQDQDYSRDRQERIDEIKGKLNNTDVDKMMSGFKILANVVGIFATPAKVEQPGSVNRRGLNYEYSIVAVAIFFALVSGITSMKLFIRWFSPMQNLSVNLS